MISRFKIINDPVHGFINIPSGTVQEIIEHPYFQRLRDIKQLGFTNLVYPGATHSRLSHALGAMHLMQEAIVVLRLKGIEIDEVEEEAALSAILMHDIGHGPYSHALENNIISGVSHEEISLALMREINESLNGRLDLAISIFEGSYEKKFLHQLISGQLDVDRLDYLKRDSFFSGVAEGMIGLERIIKMMSVDNNNLVIEEKGIYSVEKFLISRRLMYWQVYLHKTVIAAEQLLMSIFHRARTLSKSGEELSGSPAICYFLSRVFTPESFSTKEVLEMFTRLDDTDVMSAIKQWQYHNDSVLSLLCKMLTERKLPKLILSVEPIGEAQFSDACDIFHDEFRQIFGSLPTDDVISYFVNMGEVLNKGYDSAEGEIKIINKEGTTNDVYTISDMLSAKAFSQITKKHFLCRAKLKQ
ncbi:MAG: HD domain-containing protein [Bacteroidales bacterium]|nr:HD domain-containing protein [Bacteroidales bacterium]